MKTLLREEDEGVALAKLHQQVAESKDLEPLLEVLTDDILLNFLRGRMYDVDHAFETLKYYVNLRRYHFFELSQGLVPSKLKITNELVKPLKTLGPDGELVLTSRYCWGPYNEIGEYNKYEFDDFVRTVYLLCEEICRHPAAQCNGISLIIDFEGFRTKHVFGLGNFLNMKKLVTMYHKAVPIRLKGIHHINANTSVRRGIKFSKVVLPPKAALRIFKHKSLHTLHEHFDQETLPTWLGGKLTDEEALDSGINERIMSRDGYYAQLSQKISELKAKLDVDDNNNNCVSPPEKVNKKNKKVASMMEQHVEYISEKIARC